MLYLVFIFVSVLLFTGFLALTRSEARRGMRLFPAARTALDTEADTWTHAFGQIDIPTFIRTGLRTFVERGIHDIVHGSLILVRSVERLLTRAVRSIRVRHASTTVISPSGVPSSEFVAAMKDFKEELRSGRKTDETSELAQEDSTIGR